MAPEGEEGSAGGAPSTPPTSPAPPSSPSIDPNSPEIKALIEREISALKRKNDELIGEKRKMSEMFGDVDKDTLKSYVERLKNDEESRLIAEGKVDEVVERRTARMRDAYQAKLEETANTSKQIEESFQSLQEKYNNTVIDNAIRDAALKEGVVPSAIDDVLMRAKRYFTIENDRLISKDPATGEIALGADGKSPYGPTDFMSDLKKQAPHFWPGSTSGGFAPGSAQASTSDLQAILQNKGFAAYRAAKEKMARE
jgi:hypothetical protein